MRKLINQKVRGFPADMVSLEADAAVKNVIHDFTKRYTFAGSDLKRVVYEFEGDGRGNFDLDVRMEVEVPDEDTENAD